MSRRRAESLILWVKSTVFAVLPGVDRELSTEASRKKALPPNQAASPDESDEPAPQAHHPHGWQGCKRVSIKGLPMGAYLPCYLNPLRQFLRETVDGEADCKAESEGLGKVEGVGAKNRAARPRAAPDRNAR